MRHRRVAPEDQLVPDPDNPELPQLVGDLGLPHGDQQEQLDADAEVELIDLETENLITSTTGPTLDTVGWEELDLPTAPLSREQINEIEHLEHLEPEIEVIDSDMEIEVVLDR